jgi:hypothetical protein
MHHNADAAERLHCLLDFDPDIAVACTVVYPPFPAGSGAPVMMNIAWRFVFMTHLP